MIYWLPAIPPSESSFFFFSTLYQSTNAILEQYTRCIYVDMKSMFHRERDLGRFSLCVKNYSDKYDDADTLEDARIFPGDYLSVHLHLPGQAQRRPPPPPNSGSLTAGHSGGYGGQSMRRPLDNGWASRR
ncbi:hypothetical protein J056_002345 [Wallemia ichthyophaga EXF-994]|uniref:Uncharacterized protein n=1 Tax=Wallemia ichthyophaga (strain EXF-994 / CBS 113033) TaxID=1299270 RepID=R9AGN6_WALI9|nr:uncharacterized protein J056_002345 [Wallemia ichthyophaga EXF-994]EOQ99220.1 hypothetical protein J056_002345 [Wallemia ichthyophaga EXF-994]